MAVLRCAAELHQALGLTSGYGPRQHGVQFSAEQLRCAARRCRRPCTNGRLKKAAEYVDARRHVVDTRSPEWFLLCFSDRIAL